MDWWLLTRLYWDVLSWSHGSRQLEAHVVMSRIQVSHAGIWIGWMSYKIAFLLWISVQSESRWVSLGCTWPSGVSLLGLCIGCDRSMSHTCFLRFYRWGARTRLGCPVMYTREKNTIYCELGGFVSPGLIIKFQTTSSFSKFRIVLFLENESLKRFWR